MEELIHTLISERTLRTPEIIEAFREVNRADFVPESLRKIADTDTPLPTFAGQTISQPYTVAFMLELLQPKKGHDILDVGSGSGWVTGLLARIVGSRGRVYGIERVEELVRFSSDNLEKYNFKNIQITQGDGSVGLPKFAPFDRIHVAAAAQKIPPAFKEQLAVGGKMVIPTKANDIRLIEKISKEKYKETIYSGFIFVPLIEN